MKNKVYIETLGCPKNYNDSEYALGILEEEGYEQVLSPEDADFLIVNTCGFIGDAKQESIDKIFEMDRLKKTGAHLLISGCLAQRYGEELYSELPEAQAIIGVDAYSRLPEIMKEMERGERTLHTEPCDLSYLEKPIRKHPDNPYSATIKIAEGCNNRCAYCVIPYIRGDYRSKKMEDIISEAEELRDAGCKELILIAQDTGYYGKDIYGELKLPELLKKLCIIDGLSWIRIMYCYDEWITDELIDVMASEEKIVHYLDIPIQHGSDKVLKEMRRRSTRSSIEKVIAKLRKAMPDIAIRTSLIVGFPGETEEDFEELLDMVENVKFNRLGTFQYSREEGTPAGERDDQIPDEIKEERYDAVMRRQVEISLDFNKALIGSLVDVIVDDMEEDNVYRGRTKQDAPDIDNEVVFTSMNHLQPGDIVKVRVEDAFDYDLVGRQEEF